MRTSPPRSPVFAETRRLQVEHRAVAAARAMSSAWEPSSTTLPAFEHADPVGVAHGREPVRDQDRRAVARRGEDPVEDLGLAAHVELRGRLVEQHDARAQPHGAQRAGERDALPLPARQVGAAGVATRQDRVEVGKTARAGLRERGVDVVVAARRAAPRCRAAAARSG